MAAVMAAVEDGGDGDEVVAAVAVADEAGTEIITATDGITKTERATSKTEGTPAVVAVVTVATEVDGEMVRRQVIRTHQ